MTKALKRATFRLDAPDDTGRRALFIAGERVPFVNHVHLDVEPRGPARLTVKQQVPVGSAEGQADVTLLRQLLNVQADPLNIRTDSDTPLTQQLDGYVRHLLRGAASAGGRIGVGTVVEDGRTITYLYVLQDRP